jgi:hypothetical protein
MQVLGRLRISSIIHINIINGGILMTKLNHKRRKKMRRKVKRRDIGWEKTLAELTAYEIKLAGGDKK